LPVSLESQSLFLYRSSLTLLTHVKKKEDSAFHELVRNLPADAEFQCRFW